MRLPFGFKLIRVPKRGRDDSTPIGRAYQWADPVDVDLGLCFAAALSKPDEIAAVIHASYCFDETHSLCVGNVVVEAFDRAAVDDLKAYFMQAPPLEGGR